MSKTKIPVKVLALEIVFEQQKVWVVKTLLATVGIQ
jgi:hypothetical protein